jgi:hypothetical protein
MDLVIQGVDTLPRHGPPNGIGADNQGCWSAKVIVSQMCSSSQIIRGEYKKEPGDHTDDVIMCGNGDRAGRMSLP